MDHTSTLYVRPHHALFVGESTVTLSTERSGDTWRLALERGTDEQRTALLEVMPGRLVLTIISEGDFDENVAVAAVIDGEKTDGATDDLGEWACPLPEAYNRLEVSVSGRLIFALNRVELVTEALTPLIIESTPEGASATFPEVSGESVAFDGSAEGLATAILALLDAEVAAERGRTMKQRDLLKGLKKLGCTIDVKRGKGSHRLARNSIGTIPIPDHREIRKGTLTNIIKTLGYTYEQVKTA